MEKMGDWMEEDQTPEKDAAVKRSTWVSVAVNLGLTAAQMAAGVISGSQA